MKHIVQSIVFFIIFHSAVSAQHIVSVTEKGSYTKQQIISLFNIPLIKYGVKFYKVTYTSSDAKGKPDTLSGLLVVPNDAGSVYPALVYQHGTSDCKTCVPSRLGTSGGEEGQLGLLFAGMGFVSLLPDYVGMGDGRGFQTYVHAATTVSATDDMLTAVRSWMPDNGISTNNQLFITGYSQGGYASMVFHEGMQKKYGASSVTAAAHLSGPYDLYGIMRNLIISEKAYFYPAYIPNTFLGMNEVDNYYQNLEDFFKPEYISDISNYYNGKIKLSELNTRLIQKLTTNTGASVGGRLIRPEILEEIKTNPDYWINTVLSKNDAYKWVPESPTRLFYCKADDQVPYLNSIVARDSMYSRGANPNTLIVTDVNSNADHGQCVTPALTQTLLFFLTYQSITTSTQDVQISGLNVYPNPAQDKIFVEGKLNQADVIIWDMSGHQRIVLQNTDLHDGINVTSLESGIYIMTLSDDNGAIDNKKIVIKR